MPVFFSGRVRKPCLSFFWVFLIIICLLDIQTWSAAPPHPFIYDTGKLPSNLKKFALTHRLPVPKLIHFAISPAPVTTGTIKVMVLLIQFSDQSPDPSHTAAYFDNLIFSGSGNSMSKYYQEVSYGKALISGTIGDGVWLQSNYSMAYYGADSGNDIDSATGPIWRLAREAVQKAVAGGVDFSGYDTDNDNVVDHIIIVHSGPAQERSGSSNDIWSHHWQIGGNTPSPVNVGNGLSALNYTLLSENSPVGIFAHEFGHDLGRPDLYDTDSSKPQIGDWDIMDSGAWLGGGNNRDGSQPAHFSAWNKKQLGWITPEELTGQINNLIIYPVETYDNSGSNKSLYRIGIPVADNPNNEYFLFEYRRKSGFDASLPGEGLLIWHIDDQIGSFDDNNVNVRSLFPHRRVDLIEADGIDTTQKNISAYSGDPYPGATDNTFFGATQSNAYNGLDSGTSLVNIAGAGGPTMLTDFFTIATATYSIVNNLINYPNPSRDGLVNIRFSLSRYTRDLALEIFNLAGEKIKEVPDLDLRLDLVKSSDKNWVYQYLWNGKNEFGEKVASGIYLYVLTAEGNRKIGKIAIIK